jgi:pyrophosphate--fructose-6-phosphate 1-phosphotransferase
MSQKSVVQFRPLSKEQYSPVQRARLEYKPDMPIGLEAGNIDLQVLEPTQVVTDSDMIKQNLPLSYGAPLIEFVSQSVEDSGAGSAGVLKVGVLFCGRQSSGGHNLITGVYDGLKALNSKNQLIGVIGGTKGLFTQSTMEITGSTLDLYRNMGGYSLLGRSVDQIRTPEQKEAAKNACASLSLNGLVLVGGVRTNSDAAHLSEFFLANGVNTAVVGIPGSSWGDLTNQFVEATFGFDTSCKCYSQLVGNIAADCRSNKKYYYFLRLMGDEKGNTLLECALQTQVNMAIIGEEVRAKRMGLADIVNRIADMVEARAANGDNYGVIIIPEGLVADIPEMGALLKELQQAGGCADKLTPWSSALFKFLPSWFQESLNDTDSHGEAKLSQIETERLLEFLTTQEMKKRKAAGTYKGKFGSLCSFFGYQARSSMPSNFDCSLAQSMGHCAAHLVAHNKTGYLVAISGLKRAPAEWRLWAVPLVSLLSVTDKKGELQLAIKPSEVRLGGRPFKRLKTLSEEWRIVDHYQNPGPIQFNGAIASSTTMTIQEEEHTYFEQLEYLRASNQVVSKMCEPGCSDAVLQSAATSMKALTANLALIREKEGEL